MNSEQLTVKVTLEIIIDEHEKARRLWVALLCYTFEHADKLGAMGLDLRSHAKDALTCSVDSMLVEIAKRTLARLLALEGGSLADRMGL